MDIGGGRHYMNKMFGAALDRARQEDEDHAKRGGSVARITIEPREDGKGHRVTVEKHSFAERGGAGNDRDQREFDHPEDALSFLHEIMHGREPEQTGEHGPSPEDLPSGDDHADEGEDEGAEAGSLERALRGR
jgi:hypothetical protein